MIRESLNADRIAIDAYREIINFFGENDPASRVMLEEILAKEEEQADGLSENFAQTLTYEELLPRWYSQE
jgi:bacterioferritin